MEQAYAKLTASLRKAYGKPTTIVRRICEKHKASVQKASASLRKEHSKFMTSLRQADEKHEASLRKKKSLRTAYG